MLPSACLTMSVRHNESEKILSYIYIHLNIYMFRLVTDRLCNHNVLENLKRKTAEEKEKCSISVLQANGKI